MHQQRESIIRIAERHLSAKGKTTFMPIGNSVPLSESYNDKNITRLCIKRTSE